MRPGPEAVAPGSRVAGPQASSTALQRVEAAGDRRAQGIAPVSLLLGVPVDVLTMAEALDRVTDLVVSGRAHGRSHQVVTANVDFLINASRSESLRWILRRSQLVIADGMPLVWASRLLGADLPERVAGADLVPLLAERSEQQGFSMLLFGGAPGIADAAAEVLRRRCPSLRVTAMAAPFFDQPEEMDPALLEAVAAHRPDIMCVALGHPKQDRWIATYGPALTVPVMIGVGGSLDFLAGATRRAPTWMQRTGLEWLHRLALEPRRLAARYSRDLAHFGPRIVMQRVGRPPLGPGEGTTGPDGADVVVRVLRRLDGEVTPLALTSPEFLAAAEEGVHAVIDLEQLGRPTWARVLSVVAVSRHLRRHGGDLLTVASPRSDLWWSWHRHLDGLVTVAPEVPTAEAVAAGAVGGPTSVVARRQIGRVVEGARDQSGQYEPAGVSR